MSGILSEMAGRLKELVDADVHHNPKMHEGLNHCEGCERLDIVNKLREHLRYENDTQPQQQLGGLSRKDTELPKVAKQWEVSKAAKAEREAKKK